MKKTILLAVPEHVGFPAVLKKNLEYVGFEVSLITVPAAEKFKYRSLLQRLHNLFRKVFLRDKAFKAKLFLKNNVERLLEQLRSFEYAEYALFIRPDLFPVEIVRLVKEKCSMLVGYQWDGLDRYPAVHHYIAMMDRFFVFDGSDLISDKILGTTNFYFDFDFALPRSLDSANQTLYYIGSYVDGRTDLIKDIDTKFKILNRHRNIKIVTNNDKIGQIIATKGLTSTPELISYEENMQHASKADILLDIQNPIHNGLSFRIFEGLGYMKKVITTNEQVIHYDFYRSENILIWKGQSVEELRQFLEVPYSPIPSKIREKYSFTNWISYALDLPHHTPITLPR
ncbi:hypothetical protein [Sphingobacterium sp. FBM7-1]|uniref:hypothetical protein n=1 Tax=Sphingobacterium sp. FBM7-1 TaxID=2886688 RepID=UPI001D110582|nr:hypothetical protein [Sphingobacterium sp. FBM7-1]MCC2599743.1 hypothetical protein [Sphingobacterium sp. FBM7-1]